MADEPEQDPKSAPDARLTSLNRRLDKVQQEEADRAGKVVEDREQNVTRSVGMRILSDLVGLPFGAGLVGWLVDRWLDTRPWVMLAMLFLGFGLAIRNVMRIANQASKGPGE
ncbi:MAG TPA: AtpZ/AtpI family protein [Sphingomicrobium sp.]|jgi:ATP synthase protein I|nr:AtpZ/AtpI family protein [Sphingomicrobium sp.]